MFSRAKHRQVRCFNTLKDKTECNNEHLQSKEADQLSEIQTLREDLAAVYRMCARHGLNEGICNHITAAVEHPDAKSSASLVIPHGFDWSEVTANCLLLFDNETGALLEGKGKVESSAFNIHASIHMCLPEAKIVIHTHMPYATALTSLENNNCEQLAFVNQNALPFFGRIAYDDEYHGLVNDREEGNRIARKLRGKCALFMANHGVTVIGRNVAEAWHELYYLERACMNQVLAMSTGRPLKIVEPEIAIRVRERSLQDMEEYAGLHFAAQKRILRPGFSGAHSSN